ncbi:murein biosynthesis integral membrane protein MurJ [Amycolatopsis nigrescens]|uniref:murein biosynthesis integral membrane protein MurJ n=1 Tax=Amycolatopsis nigrescens TaxID=381445 RepID=UPI0003794A7B|nr:murein biosynthesis integral membrane protein MurJ [Amycolatopsis nigrescens]
MLIPRDRWVPPGVRWPTADQDMAMLRPYDEFATRMLPRFVDVPQAAEPVGDSLPDATGIQPKVTDKAAPSLAKASGRMAIATLTSRITGFAWKVMLGVVATLGVVYDSFTVANTLPLMVNELLLGGVLTSVMIPLLVRSQDDEDGGQRYTQQLVTLAITVLAVGAVLSTIAAPLLTSLLVEEGSEANSDLATAFAYLLLPGLLFYGLFAVLSAILNAKQIFGPAQWAPVVNNLVIFATIGLYALVPGDPTLNPLNMSDPKLLVLGLGVLTAMVVQAAYLLPALRRSGFKFKWRWGIDSRLKEFGGLALWIFAYVAVSQIGVSVTTRVLTLGTQGSVSTYSNAWLLFQLPYGVIGVSLLTAIMPRMSRAAADGDTKKLIGDLSYGSRLSTLTLLPVSAVMVVAGTSIGVALFALRGDDQAVANAERLGQALAVSAFGLLPYALVMLQMRVFYAMKDSRTPTLIMVVMTGVKIPLLLLASGLLSPRDLVLGVMMVNSLSFVVGAVMGQVWLWVKLGNLRSKRVIGVILFTVVASGLGAAAAVLVGMLVPDFLGPSLQAWIELILQGVVGMVVSFGVLIALKIPELDGVTRRFTRLIKRG